MNVMDGPSSSTPPISMFTWYGFLRIAVAISVRMYEEAPFMLSFKPVVESRDGRERTSTGEVARDGGERASTPVENIAVTSEANQRPCSPVLNSFSAMLRCMYSVNRTQSAEGPAAASNLCESN